MPFVKLDTGIIDSTLWVERECREVFITALLLAEPFELLAPTPQLSVRSLDETGFIVPAGWYGFVHAAGVGILRRAIVDAEAGMVALERLGAPDLESRSSEFEGRRLVRVDGGFIVLNFMKYRDRDYTTADRSRRYRERQKLNNHPTPSHRDAVASHRDITQAEAEAEAEKRTKAMSGRPDFKPVAIEILNFLNSRTSRAYRPTDTNLGFIIARLRDGATAADCRQVIAKKAREWSADELMALYLRPATLFNREKFDQYSGELVVSEQP